MKVNYEKLILLSTRKIIHRQNIEKSSTLNTATKIKQNGSLPLNSNDTCSASIDKCEINGERLPCKKIK